MNQFGTNLQTVYWNPANPSASVALEAWREGLLTEDEARKFFGLGPKEKPCPKCKS